MASLASNGLEYTLHRLFIMREDTYAIQQSDGTYLRLDQPLTLEVLQRHLAGMVTIGVYQINPENNAVKWLCFDVDPEHVNDSRHITHKIFEECKRRFTEMSVWLEASRYPDPSYHIWVFFEPQIPAKAARWLGEKILEHVGVVVEVFPKQDAVNLNNFGNLVKLPLAFHRRERKWSKFLNPATFKPIPANCLTNAIGCNFSERDLNSIIDLTDKQRGIQLKFSTATQTYKKKRSVRPCLSEALKDKEIPHLMRLAVAVEYLSSGLNVDEVVDLFRDQADFDIKKTSYQVSHAKEREYKPYKCTTIRGMGYCIGTACPIFRRRKQLFERMVNTL